ncbi:MAG: SHOCT domain-containing protein, partial [Acidimicrobiales bacterium]
PSTAARSAPPPDLRTPWVTDTPPHGVPVAGALTTGPVWPASGDGLDPWHDSFAAGAAAAADAGMAGRGRTSVHDQLIRLDDLRRRGIITADEFQVKKADLLSRL